MKEIKSLKPLTKTQEEKCDKIVSLLLELKKISEFHHRLLDQDLQDGPMEHSLDPCNSKCGAWTSSSGTTWELAINKKAEF